MPFDTIKYSFGPVAEELGKGLQNPVQQCKSAPDLKDKFARMLKLVYSLDLKSSDRKVVWVRVPLRAPE